MLDSRNTQHRECVAAEKADRVQHTATANTYKPNSCDAHGIISMCHIIIIIILIINSLDVCCECCRFVETVAEAFVDAAQEGEDDGASVKQRSRSAEQNANKCKQNANNAQGMVYMLNIITNVNITIMIHINIIILWHCLTYVFFVCWSS